MTTAQSPDPGGDAASPSSPGSRQSGLAALRCPGGAARSGARRRKGGPLPRPIGSRLCDNVGTRPTLTYWSRLRIWSGDPRPRGCGGFDPRRSTTRQRGAEVSRCPCFFARVDRPLSEFMASRINPASGRVAVRRAPTITSAWRALSRMFVSTWIGSFVERRAVHSTLVIFARPRPVGGRQQTACAMADRRRRWRSSQGRPTFPPLDRHRASRAATSPVRVVRE